MPSDVSKRAITRKVMSSLVKGEDIGTEKKTDETREELSASWLGVSLLACPCLCARIDACPAFRRSVSGW